MLNFIYWPISAVLWFWHKIFAFPFGADSAWSWIFAIMFLTFTLRLLLLKPMINQMRSSMKMQKMAPRMREIQAKYKNDQQKLMEETRKLQKEMGVNPLLGCLPALAQLPVFIGLFHVLRSFNRTGEGTGQLGMSPEQNRMTPNYIFGVDDVQSFLDANIFGVPLSAFISMPKEMYAAFPTATELSQGRIFMVAAPLIAIIAFATHMNARLSVERMNRRREEGKTQAASGEMAEMQQQMMSKMMMWVMPFTILITGAFWHIGLLVYMMSNNIWTFFQQRYIFKKIDAEEDAEIEQKKAAQRSTAPKPGVKPNNPKKKKKK
ncbi:inner membrane protein translocase component YidC [Corynebacterium renale]|uniref:Membrane protein insertase YidC n=1 Tax=Corynebacterium renale TaxID=1724 RepID=A0A2A9DP08_9CORY|nr:membrane protein insertase YidC [Corynebacterium renale]PFG27649.1 YidC/Oxa1 family membrane protein insertase [Corynebacterium renale]SQG63642.1 inner membrane protein translocase component YidC [Corynebacterium renale]SQI22457.1 inner membrane protein translocase component YidC [Corynebacterium renale]STD01307.1 inner membrane protein translocase component YidC [Corynebacterium renale]